ncbi:N-(5'-phosphoribosyl)anthranilate isomerase [Roseovarius spongiae]|nr:N-(5'-phosphoribosyl)anthranilate isomerase [Roseovarius spongiae]
MTRITDPECWLDQMFAAKAAQTGGVLRRSRAWIDREVGFDRFELEVRRRGFHMIESADQILVVCHNDPIRILF